MTKSRGIGRGGTRPNAGRKPSSAKVDWNEVRRAYFSGASSIEDICAPFGLDYGDLLAHAASRHWARPSPKRHPDDVGDLGSALAFAMFSVTPANRIRWFVAAMARLVAEVVATLADAVDAEITPR